MILNVVIHNKWQYAETWPQMDALITEVTENLASEGAVTVDSLQFQDPGEDAQFMVADRRLTDDDLPANHLRVAVNRSTGYGALIWHATKNFPKSGDIYDHIWVSDNPQPPNLDPRVLADPCEPRFHDRRSTLPAPDVRQALEEFCRTGTGDRPQSIGWVRGWLNGHRLDESP
ncbi:immunity protein Imm1 of predicted polymorphic toxin system [Krasilnikovia cinnamomea]|uniref:Immunity protein Imm1 of predicted polymorphic toxin system n=1 Tax=Krasilnikovia cinnamomea TaxID=349313 RepID=A0A4Q7ZLV0_9ACTN|nr:Imm1 family immunity protein [Krasilnikovia cinnamomea]RZU51219.1 immunity protein Imm1 of predicted polymorphic toxin system [Krasilnikovia cinnamomea]